MPEDIPKTPSVPRAIVSPSGVLPSGQETSPIHPDIEEGARHILEERLVEAVRIGSIAGIKVGVNNLANAWQQAQKAADATFELTPEGKQVIPGRVKEIALDHLQEGLARLYEVTEFGIRSGFEHTIKGEPQRLYDLFKVAEEFQIPLAYLPPDEGTQPVNNTLAVSITTADQAQVYMQEVINRNLPRGMQGIINILGFQVGQGLLKQLPEYEQRIERWIEIMQQRGYTLVDKPPAPPIMGEDKPGLLVREVNRAEIRELVDQAVRDNLAKGARHISTTVAHMVKSGFFNPVSTWGTPENIALYAEAGRKYGLVHHGAVTTENSDINPEMYFDPAQLPQIIRDVVAENLPVGLEAIQNRHLQNIRSGNASQIEFSVTTMEQYIALASEYGVNVNPDQLRTTLASHLTTENLQEGVNGCISVVRDALRKGNYLSVSVKTKEAEKFRQFVHKQGFDSRVNFSELDQYLKETGTQTPQLTEGTT